MVRSLSFILEMFACCIFESLSKYVREGLLSLLSLSSLSVNKPALQLSAPSCPLRHTIYLFTGVAAPLTLPLLLSLCFLPSFPLLEFPLPRKVLHAKWWIQAIRVCPTPSQQQSFLASRPPALLSQMLFFRELKHFRFTLPPGQRAPNVPRPQNCAVNNFG